MITFTSSNNNDMKSKLHKSQLEAAKILGIADFNNGIKSSPCLSKACMSLVQVNQHIKGASIAIMSAWAKGWDIANLAS